MDSWVKSFASRKRFEFPYGPETVQLIASPDLTLEVPSASNNSFMMMEGEKHRLIRQNVFQYLSKGTDTEALRVRLGQRVADFSPPGDFVRQVIHPVIAETVFDVYQIPEEIREEFAVLLFDSLGCLSSEEHDARKAIGKLSVRMSRIMRNLGSNGLLADLKRLADNDHITNKEATSSAVAALHGGHENPVLLIASYIAARLSDVHTPTRQIAHKYGPVEKLVRIAQKDDAVDGCPMQKGDVAYIYLGDESEIHLPYGRGHHVCPGQKLSQQIIDTFSELDLESLRLRVRSSSSLTNSPHRGVRSLVVDPAE